MRKQPPIITELNHQAACEYMEYKFDTRSWWPRAQPELAKREFRLMKGSSGALSAWCIRWLDLGQLRKLKQKIR